MALSRLVLLKDVWDKNFDTNTNVVDVYVNYLRNKIDRDFEVKLIRHDCRDGVYHGGTVKPGRRKDEDRVEDSFVLYRNNRRCHRVDCIGVLSLYIEIYK